MELSNFRQESHVAQQSRRDKLRVQQQSSISQVQHLEDYSSNLEQLSSVHHQALNPDLIQVSTVRYGNISYNPAMFTSEMLNYAANSHVLLPQNDGLVVHQESAPDHGSPGFANSSHPVSSSVLNAASKAGGDPQNCGNWKSIGSSQQSCDWIVNYSSGLSASESNQNHPVLFAGVGLTSSVNANNHLPSPAVYLKSGFNVYQDVNPSSEVSSQNNSQKQYGEIHFSPSSLYQNNPLAGVTSAMAGTEGLELASLVHQNPGRDNELLLLPAAYGDQSNQWSSELGFLANKSNRDLRTVASDSNTQGLSLSLSPGLPNKSHNIQFEENLHSGTGVFNDHHGSSRALKPEYSCFNSKPSSSSDKVLGNACQDVGSPAITHRNSGPLGPFTGYATILKGSKFLKPAQQLLDEICFVNSAKSIETSEVSDKVSNEVRGSADAVNASESVIRAKGGDSGVSSSTFYSSNQISGDGGVRSSSGESSRPEYQHKKAKLMFMQDEVCRRYKQYHQQMQMVVSSFESVAGLSAAAPYISLALKTVSRHFRCLRIAISDQLKHIRKALGEDFLSPTTGASSSKGDSSSSRLKFFDHGFTKQKSGGGGTLGFFEPQQQQHIWRPQRGLPERAVAILRAWLFEHFLHPYPTDTDKHMLATQTGLSRNQVSNWFINARVRVWKPMVEEIHMLETKGLAESNSNAGKTNDGNPTANAASRTYDGQSTNKFSVTPIPGKQVEIFQIGSLAGGAHGQNVEQWNQEKRSRVECQIPAATMDGSLMGFVPYQRSGLEMGGLGAVSLTLGLRQSAEGAQQQQQQQLQQQEHQLRQHFGGQMIHDFVG